MRLESLSGVEIVPITSPPAERATFGALQAAEVDTALLQRLELLDWIIGADDADDAHLGEVACRCGKESRGATEDIVRPSERSLHRVECHRANNEDRHSCLYRLEDCQAANGNRTEDGGNYIRSGEVTPRIRSPFRNTI